MDLTKGRITIDFDNFEVAFENGAERQAYATTDPRAFTLLSAAWLRGGWDAKYVYTFSWFGRPIIQLPDDVMRLQEVIYDIKPDVIVETGVAHGGSLTFYATLCKAMGRGRVIGVDIEIRDHNRKALEGHELFEYITLIEGSSVRPAVVEQVRSSLAPNDRVMVILDSNHSQEHVAAELELYSPLVSVGSYIIATDGIMRDLEGAPRSQTGWSRNNPFEAAKSFVENRDDFIMQQPTWAFNESVGLSENVTYWPGAWLKRVH